MIVSTLILGFLDCLTLMFSGDTPASATVRLGSQGAATHASHGTSLIAPSLPIFLNLDSDPCSITWRLVWFTDLMQGHSSSVPTSVHTATPAHAGGNRSADPSHHAHATLFFNLARFVT